jgi:hypothetical protein
MDPRVYMHELFDFIINPVKYKHETYQVFIHPFLKMNAKCNL